MGTRSLACVALDKKFKVAQYCQFDGYPGGQGVTSLEFCRKVVSAAPPLDLATFRQRVAALGQISQEQVDKLWEDMGAVGGFADPDVSENFKDKYAHLHRETGADVFQMILDGKATEVHLRTSFAGDSLFCEWAYVIDLDKNVLEVHKGYNQKPIGPRARFAAYNDPTSKYRPVRKIRSFKLSALPTAEQFIDLCDHPSKKLPTAN